MGSGLPLASVLATVSLYCFILTSIVYNHFVFLDNCTAPATNVPRFEEIDRWSVIGRSSLMHIFMDMTIPCSGLATKWLYYSLNAPRVIYFDIWRQVEGSGLRRVCPSTKSWTKTKGMNEVVIPDGCQVLQGDILGFHYPDHRLPFSLTVLPLATEEELENLLVDKLFEARVFKQGEANIFQNGSTGSDYATVYRTPPMILVIN